MKNLKIYTLLFAILLSVTSLAQSKYATFSVNKPAIERIGLSQQLNATGDTLLLKTSQKIYKLSILFHSEKETLDIEFDHNEVKIPLYLFKKGNITIAVHPEQGNIYPIALSIHANAPKPIDAIADVEESILRSSLPEKEQRKRNLKPRPKRNNDTRLANVNQKPDTKKRELEERIRKEAQVEAKKNKALAETNERIKKEAQAAAKRDNAIAEAKQKEAKEKQARLREKAIVEANREKLKKKAIAEARDRQIRKEAKEEAEKYKRDAIANAKSDKEKIKNSIAAANKKQSDNTKELNVKEVKYNISDIEHNELEKQSREEYRKENLRPNGKTYDE